MGLLVFFVAVVSPTTLVPPVADLPASVGWKGSGKWVKLTTAMMLKKTVVALFPWETAAVDFCV